MNGFVVVVVVVKEGMPLQDIKSEEQRKAFVRVGHFWTV